MIAELSQRAVLPFRWVTSDERYGEIPAFLEGIAALGKWYLAEVAADTRAWVRTPPVEPPGQGLLGAPRKHPRVKPTAPQPSEMRDLVKLVPGGQWQRRKIKEGSKGPLVAEFACMRVTPIRDELPGQRCWAIFRRTLGSQPEVKFFVSNAPATCSLPDFVRVSGLRWPIETGLEEAKGEVGMDHYETRTWRGWHHHMTLSILAHLFLVRLQLVSQKKSRLDHRPSAPTHRARHRRSTGKFARHPGDIALSPASESCGVLFTPPQTEAFEAAQATAQRQSLVVISQIS